MVASSFLLDTAVETCKKSEQKNDVSWVWDAIFLATNSHVAMVLDTSRAQLPERQLSLRDNGCDYQPYGSNDTAETLH